MSFIGTPSPPIHDDRCHTGLGRKRRSPFMVHYLFHETAQISHDLSGGDLGNGRQNILPGDKQEEWYQQRVLCAGGGGWICQVDNSPQQALSKGMTWSDRLFRKINVACKAESGFGDAR